MQKIKKFILLILIILCFTSSAEAENDNSTPPCGGMILVFGIMLGIYSFYDKKQKNKLTQDTTNTAQNAVDKCSLPRTSESDSFSQIKAEKAAKSIQNIILGYGSDYVIPSRSLLDDLADTYGYTQASQDYKNIRSQIKEMIKKNLAADCYVLDKKIKQAFINMILDAFNGRVEPILAKATTDNFGTLKQKIIDAFNIVNYHGSFINNSYIKSDYLNLCIEELRLACIMNEIHKMNMEEQRMIKEKIREEEKARREIEKAIKSAQQEEAILQKAINKVRAEMEQANIEQRTAYELQIKELEQKYKEAEERNKRALSMAQQTKSGYIYIISNEGSFGRDIYKIGMTRRLEPLDRIRELSNASVPFPFEVHAMIWSENAPELETILHKKFALFQVNKVNFRKEFFKIPLSEIRAELEKNNLNIKWTITADTTEYLESLAIEKTIQNNEQAREAWLNHQLVYSSVNLDS